MSVAYEHSGPWTVQDVLTLGEDRQHRHELLDGTLMMSPAPGIRHQRASRRLANVLDQAARAVGAPVEVLEAVNVTVPSGLFIPDIAVVDRAATQGDPVVLDAEAVSLVVEIVSPGTRHMDLRMKPMLYAEAGIEGYWRLELAPTPYLVVADLKDGGYVERVTARAGVTTELTAPFPVLVDPGALTER
ncbi:MAG TPA: Uma2 family endonuclease [Mycobacteriales bacterium]